MIFFLDVFVETFAAAHAVQCDELMIRFAMILGLLLFTTKTVGLVANPIYLFIYQDFLFYGRYNHWMQIGGFKVVTRQWETHCGAGGAVQSGRCHISIFLWHTRHVISLPFQTQLHVSRRILSKPITAWWRYCWGSGTVDQKAPRHNLISLPFK